MICSKCKKRPATVHIKKIHQGKEEKLNLCSECASGYSAPAAGLFGLNEGIFSSLSDMLAGFSDIQEEQIREEDGCPSCKKKFREFQQSGRLGCPGCYEYFSKRLMPLLKRIQGSVQHAGKSPPGQSQSEELKRLKNDLRQAVEKEEYERAAVIRDKIREIEAEGNET